MKKKSVVFLLGVPKGFLALQVRSPLHLRILVYNSTQTWCSCQPLLCNLVPFSDQNLGFRVEKCFFSQWLD